MEITGQKKIKKSNPKCISFILKKLNKNMQDWEKNIKDILFYEKENAIDKIVTMFF